MENALSPLQIGTGVYAVRNLSSGRRYVGSSVHFRKRFRTHRCALRKGRHHSKALQQDWNTLGEAAFTFEPVIVCEMGDAVAYEKQLIEAEMKTGTSYNSNAVVHATRHSEDSRKRASVTNSGAGNPMFGRHLSERSKQYLRDWATGRKHTPEEIAKQIAAQTGKPCSQSTREKISRANMGRRHPQEVLDRIGATRRANPLSPKMSRPCSSRYIGVSFQPDRQRWISYIRADGKRKYLGRFKDETEAARAYDAAAKIHFGARASYNFPEKKP